MTGPLPIFIQRASLIETTSSKRRPTYYRLNMNLSNACKTQAGGVPNHPISATNPTGATREKNAPWATRAEVVNLGSRAVRLIQLVSRSHAGIWLAASSRRPSRRGSVLSLHLLDPHCAHSTTSASQITPQSEKRVTISKLCHNQISE